MNEFVISKENGKIQNTVSVRQQIDLLKDGIYKLVRITSAKPRTDPLRKYYFGVMVPMVKIGLKETGERKYKTNKSVHEFLKDRFLTIIIIDDITGLEVEKTGSTADLNTHEFIDYMEQIWQYAAEILNTVIPSPNTQVDIFAA